MELAASGSRRYVRRIDDQDPDPGPITGVVVVIGGGTIVIDVVVKTLGPVSEPPGAR